MNTATFAAAEVDGVVLGVLTGEVDLANASDLERQIVQAVPNHASGLVLELSEVTYLDSSGIRLVLSLAGRLRWRGQDLVLAAPPDARCRRVLAMAGVERSVSLAATKAEARGLIRSAPLG